MSIQEYLESLKTRQLMSMLNQARSCGWCYAYVNYEEVQIDHANIKAVLDTREHIPNKHEAKALRRAMAKQGR